ncbi:DMT family transporter [Paenibacillus mucilaginosus]|uniref:DMT family permease n=1 Tax=Paenibacillus mucilaginosus (strain KNP414) TaxID=1036673 RepID=F8FHG0_PAEMK|nr:DMT family transporter [Paenibacillus mucilaginosus]AEI42268.1 DMT family permease [Paenibacillus mucilaginosus KNP414]WDM28741.1 EamA family transporter [Paenibacillus mucilaginosus]
MQESTPGSRLLPHLGFVIVYVLWGINICSMKFGGQQWDPLVFGALRYASILPFLWAYTWWYYRKHRGRLKLQIAPRDLLLIALLGVVSAVGMEVVLQYALQYSNSANGAVLGRGFMPVITACIALLLKDLRLTPSVMVGIPLALGSVILIVAGGPEGFHLGPETLRGDLLLLLRSFLGALYLIGMNKLVGRYPLTLLVSLEMTAGALALLPFLFLNADLGYLLSRSDLAWLSLAYTALFATLIGFSIHNWSLARLGPFKASVYGYLLPVTAAAAGYVLLGEELGWNQYLGGAGVLFAMYLVQRDRMQLLKASVSAPAAGTDKPA